MTATRSDLAPPDAPDTLGDTIPVTVVTGFLGSGKTTVLNRVLKHPGMAETAVIVNEFGAVGIDHLLVETAFEDTVLLDQGCICCAIRGDLVDTLDRLAIQRRRGEVPAFVRVAIETTGLADPAPVLQTLMREDTLVRRYRLNGVATTVDAVNGRHQLAAYDEAVKQAALADRLLVTKVDMATAPEVAALKRYLARINPAARIDEVVHGDIGPETLFGGGRYDTASGDDGIRSWLDADAYLDGEGGKAHRARLHDGDIGAFCLVREAPVSWPAVRSWLQSVTSLRGADVLRVKGLVNVAGMDTPMVVHGVQHVFHQPERLARWPDDDRRTRIVCIVRGIAQRDLEGAFEAAQMADVAAAV